MTSNVTKTEQTKTRYTIVFRYGAGPVNVYSYDDLKGLNHMLKNLKQEKGTVIECTKEVIEITTKLTVTPFDYTKKKRS